ncbi:hypothetical protein [Limnohabitans sp.]|uniref:hypothetical protein n=1 Tax=Limnohabitans sp. TaxID=1907725 RepID=UPI0035B02504
MTDTLIKPTLDIRSFSAEDKANLNYALGFNNRTIPGGVLLAPCSTPTWVSNVGSLKGKLSVYTTSATGQAFNPDSLVFKHFHAPNILVGHNTLHGTSVYATCQAFLLVCKVWLAKSGVAKATLDALSLKDVRIHGVDITFLQACSTAKEADGLVRLLSLAAQATDRDEEFHAKHKSNPTTDIRFKATKVEAYIKMELKHCKFSSKEIKVMLTDLAKTMLRIEVKLREQQLGRELMQATAWETAYAENRYEAIFNDYVLKSIEQALAITRVRKPNWQAIDSALAKLNGDNRVWASTVLNAYFAGEDLDELYAAHKGTTRPENRRRLRKHFKAELGVDIDIPWATHLKLGKQKVSSAFKYPGDYHPPESLEGECFCKANWTQIRQKLEAEYEACFTKVPHPSATHLDGVMAMKALLGAN